MVSTAVAQFDGVSKTYHSGWFRRSSVPAVREVSLSIEPGEAVGLLGPNRAGKTTLIKLLLSLCAPSQGSVFRFGRPAADRRTLAQVGYVHEKHAFPGYYSAAGLLNYYAALALIPHRLAARRVDELLVRVGLAEQARTPIAHFSKGMVQRLALAQALLNDPRLLVLDEPAEGLDLAGRQLVCEVIAEQKKKNAGVLLVSHVIREAEKTCDRIAVLKEGRLLRVGPTASFTDTQTGKRPVEHALQEIYREGPCR